MNEQANERIVLDVAYQPQVRTAVDTRCLMRRVILALLPAVLFASWQFGGYSLLLVLVSVCSAVFFEWAWCKLVKKRSSIDDLSAALTGLFLALTLPPSAPLYLPVIGTFFAIVVVKQLYGGLGKNFLNPALAARAFLLASYAAAMGRFPLPAALSGKVDALSMATPLAYLYGDEAMPSAYGLGELFFGFHPGSMGETAALLLLLGGLYLIVSRVISWRIPVSYLGTVALLALIFGRAGYGRLDFMLYNLLSGGVILGAFFMATDYVTSPVTPRGQLLYGFGCGALTMLIRAYGGFPEGVTYAILLMNLCAWAIDKLCRRRRIFGMSREEAKEGVR